MQVHGPSESIHDETRISAVLNPGSGKPFASMNIGSVRLYIVTPEECDWLIKAAVKAKRLLTGDPALKAPTAYIAFGDPQPVLEGKAVQHGEHPYPAVADRVDFVPDADVTFVDDRIGGPTPMQRYNRQAHIAWHERTHPDADIWPRQPLTDDEAAAAIADYEGTGEQS